MAFTWRTLPGRLGRQLHVPGNLTALDQGVNVAGAARVEEDVALPDARLLGEQARREERLANGLGERAVVAGEAPGEVGELGVVAAPLAHAVEALQDAPRDAAGGVGVVVGARHARRGVERGEDGVLVLLHRGRVGRAAAER